MPLKSITGHQEAFKSICHTKAIQALQNAIQALQNAIQQAIQIHLSLDK